MRENRLVIWLALAVFLIAVLNMPIAVSRNVKHAVREAIAPLQEAVAAFWRSLHEGAHSVRGIGTVFGENQRLAGEVTRLQGEVRELRSLAVENDGLRRQLAFLARAPRALVACEVIARDQDGWWQTMRLNKGSADGVSNDMAVVSVEGLVGKTIDVSAHTADVLLISDPNCKVSATISRAGSFGVLSGRGPSMRGQVVCRMDFINKSQPLNSGDEVLTSGLGGVFPKGLLIGYADKIYMDDSGLYQHADVISKADLGRLQYAFVVKGPVAAGLIPGKEAAR